MKKETILEIHEDGTYKLYYNNMNIIPQSEEAFKNIVENKKLTVKFTKMM